MHPLRVCEYDEDVRQAAQREFQEETGLLVEVGEVYAVHSIFTILHRIRLASGFVVQCAVAPCGRMTMWTRSRICLCIICRTIWRSLLIV